MPRGGSAVKVVVADVTGDAHPDVSVGVSIYHGPGRESGAVLVFPGDGRGRLLAPLMLELARPVFAMTAADFTGDGISDLALATEAWITVVSASGGAPRVVSTFAANADAGGFEGAPMSWLGAIDLDANGTIDLLSEANRVEITTVPDSFLGDGHGGFSRAPTSPPLSSRPCGLASGDVNGDGHLDLVQSTGFSSGVLLADGGGQFKPPTPIYRKALGPDELPACAVSIVDLDADGHPDLVTSSYTVEKSVGFVRVHRGRGDGTFEDSVVAWPDPDHSVSDLAVGDVNGDRRPDAIFASGRAHGLTRPAVAWLDAVGTELPARRTDIRLAGPAATQPVGIGALGIGDFDGDDRIDAVALIGTSGPLVVVTRLADSALLSGAGAPPTAPASRSVLVRVRLVSAATVTIKIIDDGGGAVRLARRALPAGRSALRVNLPADDSDGLQRARFRLWIHANRHAVSDTRLLPITVTK